MSVSLTKENCIPASRAAGRWVHLFPGGNPVLVTSVHRTDHRPTSTPRVRLYATLGRGGTVQVTYPAGAGLRPAQGI